MELEIVYHDEHLIAINKPHGLLVHRSAMAHDVQEFALQMLRDQIEQKVYLAHRIDRKTGGVLLFALSEEMLSAIRKCFMEEKVQKTYFAIVRGYTDDEGVIDYPLYNEKEKLQEAYTEYKTIERVEVNVPSGNFDTSRYSFVQVYPKTGRMHQIRKHMAHIYHPIIGDRPHGCNKQNRLFKEKWRMITMMLHAREIQFEHPITKEKIIVRADFHDEYRRTVRLLGFSDRVLVM